MHTLLNIDVPELQPAIEFYCNALGLRLKRVLDDDVAELSDDGFTLYLLASPAGSTTLTANTRDYCRHWTPVHIDFVVDDVDAAAERAIAAGAVRESECIEWRGSKCITLSDPFGHGFCFIEFAEGSYSE